MNIAIILAGGSGARMYQESLPKQFVSVFDKPIVIHTLEIFEKHEEIDSIFVSCRPGWIEAMRSYVCEFGINKVEDIVPGGEFRQTSIENAVNAVAEKYDGEDIILIHDAVRPMVSPKLISDNIRSAKENFCAITIMPCTETVLSSGNGTTAKDSLNRANVFRTQTPQTLKLKNLLWAKDKAGEMGIIDSSGVCTLMTELGKEVSFVRGERANIKITEQEDLEIVRALLHYEVEKCRV